MTILPKKKHQDSKKNESDETENRENRSRRNRSLRDARCSRSGTQQDDNENLNLPSDSQEALKLPPYKRSRHRQQVANGNGAYFLHTHSQQSLSRGSREECLESDNEDGYNSSDEYGSQRGQAQECVTAERIAERELEFERELSQKKGFQIKQMATDGACLFRAVADQIYGDQEMHSVVRKHCMDYMVQNRDFFSSYITEDFHAYVRRKRNDRSHGNNIEMQAISEMYNRPIEVYQYSLVPINTFVSRSNNGDDNPPIRLSYHGNVHYNSVVDPYNPTVGVGLGLAGYKPVISDQLENTIKESEAQLLEQEMLQDKLKATDWEATDEELAEIAARESYLQWLHDNHKSTNNMGASSSSSTTTHPRHSPNHTPTARHQPFSWSQTPTNSNIVNPIKRSPPREQLKRTSPGRGDVAVAGATSNPHDSSTADWSYALGYSAEWDDDPVLAAVLAQSQQEYLESLSTRTNPSNSDTSKTVDKKS